MFLTTALIPKLKAFVRRRMYLGGQFTAVFNIPRTRAACVASDVTANTDVMVQGWDPRCGASIQTMVLSGSNMYLGGGFTTVHGLPRSRAACVDSDVTANTIAMVRAWDPNCNNSVQTMVLSGEHMYLGGAFTTVRGLPHSCAACVDSDVTANTIAMVRAWNPSCYGPVIPSVNTMVLSGSNMYLGGNFVYVSGILRGYAACVASDVTANTHTMVRDWNPDCNGSVNTMVLSSSNMYLGGNFTSVQFVIRYRAACVSSSIYANTSAMVRDWNPDCNGSVRTMVLSGNNMYLGGDFTTFLGAVTRNRAACVDSTVTANTIAMVRDWNPNCNGSVRTMTLSGSNMYLGGAFTTVRSLPRGNVACVDSTVTANTSAMLRDWDPNCYDNQAVITMVLSGEHMYLGGSFIALRSLITRNRAVCGDATPAEDSIALHAWDPNCNDSVRTMVLSGEHMYLGGAFFVVRGLPRNYAACVDSNVTANTHTMVRDWHPDCVGSGSNSSNAVRTMVLSGEHMYLGGGFTTVRGQPRNFAACVDSNVTANTDDMVRDWDPNCNNLVNAIVLSGEHVYLGGGFTTVRGQPRNFAACVDSDVTANTDDMLRDWNPDCSTEVMAMVLSGEHIYLGGRFTTVRGLPRNRAACVASDVTANTNAMLRDWNPDCNSSVFTMVLSGEHIYLGGSFTTVRSTGTVIPRSFAACVASDVTANTNAMVQGWDPRCGNSVQTMVLSGEHMYMGGSFTTIHGLPRNRAACVDSDVTSNTSAMVWAWDPKCNALSYTMVLASGD